jgi:hypothetical protein
VKVTVFSTFGVGWGGGGGGVGGAGPLFLNHGARMLRELGMMEWRGSALALAPEASRAIGGV